MGLNQPHKQQELKTFLAVNKVDFMGCIETRVKEHKAKRIQNKFARGWKIQCNYSQAVEWENLAVLETSYTGHHFPNDRPIHAMPH